MRITRNPAAKKIICFLAVATFFCGCAPPARRALTEAQRQMAQGDYAGAAMNFKTAASLLRTNAQVWNYVGLACHHAGQFADAERAYLNALALDRNLAEAHYNLGCMQLEQNQPDFGKAELTAYTSLRPGSAAGWVKLGAACLRGNDLARAETHLKEALRLDSQNAEALNDFGVLQEHRNRPRDAAQSFESALKLQPGYGPALLNLAIVSHMNLNNRPLALQKYREYLTLSPRPPNWDAVNAVANDLNQLLNPAPPPAAPIATNAPPVIRTNPITPRASTSVATQSVVLAKPVAVTAAPRTSVIISTPPPAELVHVSTQAVAPPAQLSASRSAAVPIAPVTNAAPAGAAAKPEKRTVLQRINPLNLFHRESKGASPSTTASNTVALRTSTGAELTFPRYQYRALVIPDEGDHAAAEKIFAEGVQAQRGNDVAKAIDLYRRATELDPAYFDAYCRWGIAAAGAGNLPQALRAYESALTIEPDSIEARISFAQALRQANYPLDAAAQLEEVLVTEPNDARAHLTLGNLYAQQLRQPARARVHYLKVLEVDPHNPRASDIRFWLAANPP